LRLKLRGYWVELSTFRHFDIILNEHVMSNKDEIICTCNEITRREIEDAIRSKKLQTIEAVGNETTAGTVCGACVDEIYLILEEINGKVSL